MRGRGRRGRAAATLGGELDWSDWERLFDRITLRVIFGDRARDDHGADRAAREADGRGQPARRASSADDEYYEFYGRLERTLRDPEPGSLLARFADAPQTRPHARGAADPALDVRHARHARRERLPRARRDRRRRRGGARVREEIDGADLADPAAVDGLRYLEGCLQEAMRLWPTTPLLARETTRETELAGEKLDEGTQVMILNIFNHRDPEAVPDADRLRARALGGRRRATTASTTCATARRTAPAGRSCSLLGKAVLADAARRYDLQLRRAASSTRASALPHMLDFFDAMPRSAVHERRRRRADRAHDAAPARRASPRRVITGAASARRWRSTTRHRRAARRPSRAARRGRRGRASQRARAAQARWRETSFAERQRHPAALPRPRARPPGRAARPDPARVGQGAPPRVRGDPRRGDRRALLRRTAERHLRTRAPPRRASRC